MKGLSDRKMRKKAIVTISIILAGLSLCSCTEDTPVTDSTASIPATQESHVQESENTDTKMPETVEQAESPDKEPDEEQDAEQTEEAINIEPENVQDDELHTFCKKYIDNMLIQRIDDKEQTAEPDLEKIIEAYEGEYLTADDSCMVATILYDATGDNKYRKDAEEHLKRVLGDIDFARRQSLYYGIITYLSTERSVDYKLCEALIEQVFEKANGLLLNDADTDNGKEAELYAHMLLWVNSVSFSPEYVRSAQTFLDWAGDRAESEFILHELERAEGIIGK